ncbi:molybdenum cofactor guanylyltransferase [Kordiimonas marina]|uniref:molybdenum cofactor guanylyltransferase n=1 Tax=Kordiimonas marina TaxID=2872312 RepID=UPI001FF1C7EF|nr:molybdenum cofactor guanylyltransferase [Kordiimonas marina]MCJ9430551.1 molybdenum cofactor guanylyltransferase [Kordiimonas marina]
MRRPPLKHRPLTGLILAGGRSSRMGHDKALLSFEGETLLARAERLLKAVGAERVVILGRPDHPSGAVDSTPFAGPAAAVADWLQTHPDAGQVVVIPVDMPGLRAETLTPLIAEGAAVYAGFPLPFTAFAADKPLGSVVRVRDLLSALQVKTVPVPPGRADDFININTPDDLAALAEAGVAQSEE